VWKFHDHGDYYENREIELKGDRCQMNEGPLSQRYHETLVKFSVAMPFSSLLIFFG
jgi:hypothetical protein